MDEHGYLLEALLDRFREDGIDHVQLGERAIAVSRASLAHMPRRLARFCQELDLQLVQLYAPRRSTWRFVVAWHDEVGEPRFLTRAIVGDDELLSGRADLLFRHGLREIVEEGALDEERGAWLTSLWQSDPRGAIEQIRRMWRRPRDIRLLAQAAKHGDWRAVRGQLPRLLRSARPAYMLWVSRSENLLRKLLTPPAQHVAFSSTLPSELREKMARDLAPAFPAGLRISQSPAADAIPVDATSVAQLQRAVLRALECGVERRYPDALVGRNGALAKALQSRWAQPLVSPILNCAIQCPLPSPVLMPYPFGIVMNRGTRIGSRVTVMHQVTIFDAVVEDNVTIGPGAKIIGPLRIGRGARIGPNAVVTEDVPSHSTEDAVASRRQDKKTASVVNM